MTELDFRIASEAAADRGGALLLSELHHEAAKQYPSDIAFSRRVEVFNSSRLGHEIVRRAAKSYACAERISLPPSGTSPTMSLGEAISRRRSVREFVGQDIPLDQLAWLLGCANGLVEEGHRDHPRRAIPSGGGLYPTELYVLPLGLSDLAAGAYHHEPRAQALARFRTEPAEPVLAGACYAAAAVTTATVALVVTAVFERQSIKYGERAYRFTLLEAGHLAQNVLLAATALGLDALPLGGFLDDDINKYLRLDGSHEATLYIVFVG